MKTKLALTAVGMLAAFSSTSAFADLLIYEPFNYTSGSAIIGQTDLSSPGSQTWFRAGTTSTAFHQVGTGSLTGPSGYPASFGNSGVTLGGSTAGATDFTEYARMSLGQQFTANQTIYYSVLLNVPSTTGLTTANTNPNANNDGIIAFNNATGSNATRPNTWAGELTIRLGSVANTFDLGVRGSTTPNGVGNTYWTADLTPGSTYFVVVGFTEGATAGSGGLSSMWLNPSSSTWGAASAPTPDGSAIGTYSTSASADHTDSLIIGAGIAAGATPDQTILDEIYAGTSWANVTPPFVVPEPSTFALAGLGALSLLSLRGARRR